MDVLENYSKYLGKTVHVKIDRPIGSKHPKHDFIYETNYGYLPDTRAGDGHEIDAYVLNENKPLETYDGTCIAVIVRKNDDENKLVVANTFLDAESIQRQVAFVEDHYESELVLVEKSA